MNKENITCSICLEEPHNISNINTCKHQFCFDCISRWSKVANTCPLCQVRFEKIIKTFMSCLGRRKRKRNQNVNVAYTETRNRRREILLARIRQFFYTIRVMEDQRLSDISELSIINTSQHTTTNTSEIPQSVVLPIINEHNDVNETVTQEPNRKIIKLRSRTIVVEM